MARLTLRRVPFVAQMQRAECGIASLAMVLSHHGEHVSLAELRRECPIARDGTSAFDLVETAERHGLQASVVRCDIDALEGLSLPAILHWEMNHFLVLERVDRAGAVIVDPAIGRRRVSASELRRAFSGIAVELVPGPAFAPRPRTSRLRRYAGALRGAKWPMLATVLAAGLLEVMGLLFPAASAFVVDFVVRPRQARWLIVLASAFALAVVARTAIAVARERIVSGFEARFDVTLATRLVRHLLTLPAQFFAERSVGDVTERVESLLRARDAFVRIVHTAFDMMLVLAYAALMIAFDRRLGVAVALLQIASMATVLARRRPLRSAVAARAIAAGRVRAAIAQAFADPETTKAFGAEPLLLSRYRSARADELNAHLDAQRARELPTQAHAAAETLGTALVLSVGGHAVITDRMTLGVLASFLAVQLLVAAPIQRIIAAATDLADVMPLLARIDDVFEHPPEPTGAYVPPRVEGAVTFEAVSFRYEGGPLILDRVSFHVDAGERLAILGPSGAGKSTILKLAMGLLEPLEGRVLVDGRDVRDYDVGALRARVGLVSSDSAFVPGTVFENVALGLDSPTPATVRQALDRACVRDAVDRLPLRDLTPIDARASCLSGGQRQRLLLARALAKDPSVLLLDEASSAVDAALEARLGANLDRLRCTMLVVAHRPSAIGFVDRAIWLEHGTTRPILPGAVA
jgi:ATP-binding cassette, subfamily B, bacterial